MTERALLVRHAFAPDGRFAAVGIEHAAARVFATSTGDLVAESAVPGHRDWILTALALGYVPQRDLPVMALGTADGRVILHDCAKDVTVASEIVADASTPIVSLSFVADRLIVVAASGRVSVLRAASGAVVSGKLRSAVTRASAAAAAPVEATGGSEVTLVVASSAACAVFRVPAGGAAAAHSAQLEQVCGFSGHTSAPDAVVIAADGAACLTATFGDGTIRLWDIRPSADAARGDERCRATMAVGHRLVGLNVLERLAPAKDGEEEAVALCDVLATTITGEVIVFTLPAAKLVRSAVNTAAPIAPAARLASVTPSGRFLAATPVLDAGSLGAVTIRGRWGTPAYEKIAADVIARARGRMRGATGGAAAADAVVARVPFTNPLLTKAPVDHIVLNRKKLRRAPMLTEPEAVVGATLHEDTAVPLARTVEDLPLGGLAAAAAATAAADADAAADDAAADSAATVDAATVAIKDAQRDALGGGGDERKASTTGGVVVLLHQALHAHDVPLVMELAMLAARSNADMVATVRGLRLAYLVQLLRILGDRVHAAATTSPLHGWVFTILRERGPELRRAVDAGSAPGASRDEAAIASALRTILAPILERYRRLSELSAAVGVAHGRSSVFLAVRPQKQRGAFLNALEEPRRRYATKLTRMTVIDGEAEAASDDGDDSDDGVLDADPLGKPSRRRLPRQRKERLVADVDSDDDSDAAALDDAEGSEDGDDGSSAFDYGDDYDDDEEGGSMEGDDDFSDEEGDEEGDDDDDDDDAEFGLRDDAEEGEEGDEEDDEDLAPSDDMGASGSDADGDDDDGPGSDDDGGFGAQKATVDVDAASDDGSAGSDDEDEIERIRNAHRDRRTGRVAVDMGDDEDDEDDDA